MRTGVIVSLPNDSGFLWFAAGLLAVAFVIWLVVLQLRSQQAHVELDQLQRQNEIHYEKLDRLLAKQDLLVQETYGAAMRRNSFMTCPHCTGDGSVFADRSIAEQTRAFCARCENLWSF